MNFLLLNSYETNKIFIDKIEYANFFILTLILFFLVVTIKKRPTKFLDRVETNQLKGIAIIFVVFGHLWVHVCKNNPSIVLSGDAVALFLILSGFGLSMSLTKNPVIKKDFFFKRTKRVMIPYWFATALIFLLDYIFLDRFYSITDTIATSVGINLNSTTQHIDYVRWYITFQLFWYFIFSLAFSMLQQKTGVIVLFAISIILIPLDYYFLKFGWYQLFAFPAGCLIGRYYFQIKDVFIKKKGQMLILSIGGLIFVVLFKIVFFPVLVKIIPYIACKVFKEMASIIFSLSMVAIIAYMGARQYYSKALDILGTYSYEIFLLHGVFLIKYNLIQFKNDYIVLSIQFMTFLCMVLLISFLFKRSYEYIT